MNVGQDTEQVRRKYTWKPDKQIARRRKVNQITNEKDEIIFWDYEVTGVLKFLQNKEIDSIIVESGHDSWLLKLTPANQREELKNG